MAYESGPSTSNQVKTTAFLLFLLSVFSIESSVALGATKDPLEDLILTGGLVGINCGSDERIAVGDRVFEPDAYYTGGRAELVPDAGEGPGAPMRSTRRVFTRDTGKCYEVPLENGSYAVTLLFSRGLRDSPALLPLIGVSLEGIRHGFVDVARLGISTQDTMGSDYVLHVSDGVLNLCFTGIRGEPFISGILIVRQSLPDTITLLQSANGWRSLVKKARMNVGGPRLLPGQGSLFRTWNSDAFDVALARGRSVVRLSEAAVGGEASAPNYYPSAVFRSSREFLEDSSIGVPLTGPPRKLSTYLIRAIFSETDPDVQPGERVFNLWVGGKLAFQNVDLLKKAERYHEVVLTYETKATPLEGQKLGLESGRIVLLRLEPVAGSRYNPVLNGLEVYRVQKEEKATIVLDQVTEKAATSHAIIVAIVLGVLVALGTLTSVILCHVLSGQRDGATGTNNPDDTEHLRLEVAGATEDAEEVNVIERLAQP